jgi:hypothetical protein
VWQERIFVLLYDGGQSEGEELTCERKKSFFHVVNGKKRAKPS